MLRFRIHADSQAQHPQVGVFLPVGFHCVRNRIEGGVVRAISAVEQFDRDPLTRFHDESLKVRVGRTRGTNSLADLAAEAGYEGVLAPVSLSDGALEDHRLLQVPVGRHYTHASLDVREVPVAENLHYELVQRLRPSASRAVLHDRGNVLPVEAEDVSHFVSQRQQSRNDRSSAGAEDQVEVLAEKLALKHGFHLGKHAQRVEALCTTTIERKDSAKFFGRDLRSSAHGMVLQHTHLAVYRQCYSNRWIRNWKAM